MTVVSATVIPMPRRARPDPADKPEWARWLVDQREARGWLQREFADRINVSQQSLSGYERGSSRIPEDVAEQIAVALELPYDEVRARLGMYVPAEVRQEFDGEVIRLPGVTLSPSERKALHALINLFLERHDAGGNPGPNVSFHGGSVDVDLASSDLRPAASDR